MVSDITTMRVNNVGVNTHAKYIFYKLVYWLYSIG